MKSGGWVPWRQGGSSFQRSKSYEYIRDILANRVLIILTLVRAVNVIDGERHIDTSWRVNKLSWYI